MTRPQTNLERFPTIGKHLIDGSTPAYAPTEPPQAEAPAPIKPTRPLRRLSFLAWLYLGLRRWWR
jgi:hypothetical protein